MIIYAQQNDTIDAICQRVFGYTAGVTEQTLMLNTHIQQTSPFLQEGTEVILPELPLTPIKQTVNLWI